MIMRLLELMCGCLLRVAKYIGDLLQDNHMDYLLYIDDCLIIAMVQVSKT